MTFKTSRSTVGASAPEIARARGNCAFSLIEVIVAVGLAAAFFAAIYTVLAAGFDIVRVTRENLRATQILEQKTETIRLYNWTQVTNTGFIPTNFVDVFYPLTNSASQLTYTGTVSIASAGLTEAYSNDVRLVTVKLNWKSGRVLRTRQTQTLVARYGLQNYIY